MKEVVNPLLVLFDFITIWEADGYLIDTIW